MNGKLIPPEFLQSFLHGKLQGLRRLNQHSLIISYTDTGPGQALLGFVLKSQSLREAEGELSACSVQTAFRLFSSTTNKAKIVAPYLLILHQLDVADSSGCTNAFRPDSADIY